MLLIPRIYEFIYLFIFRKSAFHVSLQKTPQTFIYNCSETASTKRGKVENNDTIHLSEN